MNFPNTLTKEEESLKKVYLLLRKKKKQLSQLRAAAKMEHKKKVPLVKSKPKTAASATEEAKKLLKEGAIKVIDQKQVVFKRSRRTMEAADKVDYEPFNRHNTETGAPHAKVKPKPLFESFVKGSQPNNAPEVVEKERRRMIPDRAGPPKKGNTIRVTGQNLSEGLLIDSFGGIGHIVNIEVQDDNTSATITYLKMECAAQAIQEMNNTQVFKNKIYVTMARIQRSFTNSISKEVDKKSCGWSSIAANLSSKDEGDNDRHSRELVSYDNIFE